MAPVILSMDVHCHICAKKIRKAAMKMPGVDSVTFGTGLVVIEGTADAAALRAQLQAKTGKAVNVVSNGVESGEAAGGGSVSGYASPPPRAPIVLEMELHCRSCAKKVEKRVMQIPGVDTVTTDVGANRVEVTGTANASAVATSLQVRARTSVRVVSNSRAPAPSPPIAQPAAGSSNPHPWPPLESYGGPPPQPAGGGYYCPALGVYGGQYWAAAPSQPPIGFYTGQCPAYPPPEAYYPWQVGEVCGCQQMWAPFQQDENPHSCCVQ